jgi:hypothetical protein
MDDLRRRRRAIFTAAAAARGIAVAQLSSLPDAELVAACNPAAHCTDPARLRLRLTETLNVQAG